MRRRRMRTARRSMGTVRRGMRAMRRRVRGVMLARRFETANAARVSTRSVRRGASLGSERSRTSLVTRARRNLRLPRELLRSRCSSARARGRSTRARDLRLVRGRRTGRSAAVRGRMRRCVSRAGFTVHRGAGRQTSARCAFDHHAVALRRVRRVRSDGTIRGRDTERALQLCDARSVASAPGRVVVRSQRLGSARGGVLVDVCGSCRVRRWRRRRMPGRGSGGSASGRRRGGAAPNLHRGEPRHGTIVVCLRRRVGVRARGSAGRCASATAQRVRRNAECDRRPELSELSARHRQPAFRMFAAVGIGIPRRPHASSIAPLPRSTTT